MEKKWLNHIITFFAFIGFIVLALSSASAPSAPSVSTQGIQYFVGKSESELVNHFKYNGTEYESPNEEYDKVLLFTNKIIRYQMSKTNYIRYKVSRETVVMNDTFSEFNDGCLTLRGHHLNTQGLYPNIRVVHTNDNAVARLIINNFNNTIRSNRSFSVSQRSEAFNRSNIGDSYYLYEIRNRIFHYSGFHNPDGGYYIQPESCVIYAYMIWRINIVAEDRPEIERRIVVTYNERMDKNFDENNNAITLERANAIINNFSNNGFSLNVLTDGHSMIAYIKNGSVIKVEEKRNQ